ncbi:MAG TPA: ribonuclease H [Acidimicrobiales bacterium]|nr:ribonuclease H [Acidimicrobiales bacterium]
MAAPDPTVVYTDGACSGNPGPGGWAWAVPGGRFAAGPADHTTNQRMEITAALEAVRALPGPLEVVSDSTYVVNCFRDRWHEGWIKRGWKNSQRQPVANRDLWEPFIELVLERRDVTFRWVKGHGGDVMNDLVDRLAVEAALTQQPREGEGTPTDLGPADLPRGVAAAPGRDGRLPAGRLVLVAGHRPDALGGYDDNPVAAGVRTRVGETLRAMVEVDGPLTVVSGLRLGAEQLGAEAALAEGLPLVAVLPYPEPDKPWPAASRAHFAELLAAATAAITLETRSPATKQLAGAALGRRDAWLARQVDSAVVVWDHEDAAVGRLVRSLEDHLGPDQVLLVHP